MDSSSDWRFKTHLANLPIYFEYQADGIGTTDAIKGTYLDNYRQIWDLYINNSTCKGADLAAKTGDDSRNEFLAGEAVFFQNGSWEYGNLVGDGKFTDDDLTMIPIYVGAGDEANQGLCTGTENFWCVNSKASEADQKATLDFMKWVVTSEEGTTMMAEQFGPIPFKSAKTPANVFFADANNLLAAGNYNVDWAFNATPNVADFRAGVVSALSAYGKEQTDEIDGSQLAVSNVVFQYRHGEVRDDHDYLAFGVHGEGDAIVFTGGKVIKGTWKRYDGDATPAKFYDENGEEIIFNQGKTWICNIWQEYGEFAKYE